MKKIKFSKLLIILFVFAAQNLFAEATEKINTEDLKKGASIYRACYYCHSLKEEVNLTGPSLANLFNKNSGENKTFKLYSENIKKNPIQWNEENLKKWIETPQSLVSGTSMTFNGLKDKDSINYLLSFLKIAMSPNGYQKVLELKWLDQETADGQLPKDITNANKSQIIQSIEHCEDIYYIKSRDGKITKHWELNIDFKINSGVHAPSKGKPVIISSGSMGDRFTILFKNEQDLSKIFKPCSFTKKTSKNN